MEQEKLIELIEALNLMGIRLVKIEPYPEKDWWDTSQWNVLIDVQPNKRGK